MLNEEWYCMYYILFNVSVHSTVRVIYLFKLLF